MREARRGDDDNENDDNEVHVIGQKSPQIKPLQESNKIVNAKVQKGHDEQDIINRLGIKNCYFFQSSFNRPNLYYEVREKTKRVLADIEKIIYKYKNKSGIIYCLSKK